MYNTLETVNMVLCWELLFWSSKREKLKTQTSLFSFEPPPPRGGGYVLPRSLKIIHWSPQIPENNFLFSLKLFAFAPQIPKNSSASPQIPKNISQFSLKCIFFPRIKITY